MSHEKMGMDHSAQELGRKRSEIIIKKKQLPNASTGSFFLCIEVTEGPEGRMRCR